MSAKLYNIGKPRALGHAVATLKGPYLNPYPNGSAEQKAFTSGYFEGEEENHHAPVIIAPDLDGTDRPPAA